MSGYRYQWALFVDWCAAADTSPLPASPITLAQFLDENPAGDAVQLRRVSAINRAHLDAGHPTPGRVTSMRLALDSARADRTIRRAAQYQAIAAGLPTEGSTAALFGRRGRRTPPSHGSRPLLHRYCRTRPQPHQRRRRERLDRRTPPHPRRLPRGHRLSAGRGVGALEHGPAVSRPVSLDGVARRAPAAQHFPDLAALPDRPGPVAVPIDRWGHLPLPAAAMTAAEIGSVIAAHRAGLATLHTPRRRISRPHADAEQVDIVRPEPTPAELIPGTTTLDSAPVAARTPPWRMSRTSSTTSRTASKSSCSAPSICSPTRPLPLDSRCRRLPRASRDPDGSI